MRQDPSHTTFRSVATAALPLFHNNKPPSHSTKREARLASVRQKAVVAQEALEAARWEVERIRCAMRGEETPQLTLDPELEALKKRMRINFPDAPTAGRSTAGRGGNGSGRPLEVARRHDEQRPQQGGLEL